MRESQSTRPLRRGLFVVLPVFLCWALVLVLGSAGSMLTQVTSNVGQAAIALTASIGCLVRARQPDYRRFWVLLGLGSLSWGLGAVTWTVYDSVLELDAFPSPADVGYIGFPVLTCAALMSLAHAPRTRAGRVRSLLDGIIVAGALLVISWLLVLGDVVSVNSAEAPLAQAISVTYPLGNVVLVTLTLFTVLRIRQLQERVPTWLWLMAAGLIGFSIADTGFAYLILTEQYASGSVVDLGWFGGFALLFLSTLARTEPTSAGDPLTVEHPFGQALPGLATLAALATTAVTAVDGIPWTVAVMWCTIIVAILLRHMFALTENRLLTRGLEERVQRRTQALDASANQFRALVEHSSDVITVVSRFGTITYQSDSIDPVLGYRATDVVGSRITTFTGRTSLRELHKKLAMATPTGDGTPEVVEMVIPHGATGEPVDVEVTVTNLLSNPDVNGLVLNTRNVTAEKALLRRLLHDGLHDRLTGLPNRLQLTNLLNEALRAAAEPDDVALLVLNLDDFKRVNDSVGHAAGDDTLVDLSKRLRACIRPGDTLARFGADEFAVLVGAAGGVDGATHVAATICQTLSDRVSVAGYEMYLRASVGVAVATSDSDAESLLRNADLAMYRAKTIAPGTFVVYDPQMHAALLEKVELERELRLALIGDDLAVHYQPTFSLETGKLTGFEALVRWLHPERGMISPGAFIPVAEESGLIREIGRYVLNAACCQAAQWISDGVAPADLKMAVNLSGGELREPGFVDEVLTCLQTSGLDARNLTLEMTESMLIQDTSQVVEVLGELKMCGISLAIDDFGTGYSSLSYLRKFPVDVLKIDRSFVSGVCTNSADIEFVRTIAQLCQNLSLRTVAEGIEERDQLDVLRLIGCDYGQGFHYSPGVPADVVAEKLAAWCQGDAQEPAEFNLAARSH